MEHEIKAINDNECEVCIKIAASKAQVEQGAIAIALSPNSGVSVTNPVSVNDAVQAICAKVKKDWLASVKAYEDDAIERAVNLAAQAAKETAESQRLSGILEGK